MKAKSCLLLLLCGITSSCATLSGSSHPSKVGNAKKAIETCQYKPVETKFIKTFDNDGVDAAIGFLETGRFEQLIGNTYLSQKNIPKQLSMLLSLKLKQNKS